MSKDLVATNYLGLSNHHNYEGIAMADQDFTLTKELLHELFEYKEGILYWKVDRPFHRIKGKIAGCIEKKGYWVTRINKKDYKNHRLIFLMHHGYLPPKIDHIDTNPLNNKIENLREATNSENRLNSKIAKNNKSGVKGVYWKEIYKSWVVFIKKDKKSYYGGSFKTILEAKKSVEELRKKLHGEFANNGNKANANV